MPIMMRMEWEGVKPEQYDALRKVVNLEADPPKGGLYHVASFTADGLHVADVWESADDFNAFVEGRLMPAVAQVGITGQPKVSIAPAHSIFAPGYTQR